MRVQNRRKSAYLESLQQSLRFSDKSCYSLVYDTGVVAFRFVGEEALRNEFYCAIWQGGVLVEDFIHTSFYQADFVAEPLEVETAGMSGFIKYVAFLNVRR